MKPAERIALNASVFVHGGQRWRVGSVVLVKMGRRPQAVVEYLTDGADRARVWRWLDELIPADDGLREPPHAKTRAQARIYAAEFWASQAA